MSLVSELLSRGKRDAVLAFLKKCSKFRTGPNNPCGRWIKDLEEGGIPDFRMNLNY
jgi:hypothetical protein